MLTLEGIVNVRPDVTVKHRAEAGSWPVFFIDADQPFALRCPVICWICPTAHILNGEKNSSRLVAHAP